MSKKSTKKTPSRKTKSKSAPKKASKTAQSRSKNVTSKSSKPVTSSATSNAPVDPLTKALIPPTKPKKSFGFSSGLLFLGCMFVGLGIGQLAGMPGTGILVGMGAGFLAMFYSRE